MANNATPAPDAQHPPTLHRRIERATGLLFGTYRVPDSFYDENPTWLVVSRKRAGYLRSIVLGRRGFYVTRAPRPPKGGGDHA